MCTESATDISIVLPVCNGAHTVERAIRSALRQSAINLELVIVDDASTDATPRIIHKAAHRDSRIMIVHNKNNMGLALSRYIGIQHCKGKYIGFIDDDDMLYEGVLAAMYQKACEEDLDMVMSGVRLYFSRLRFSISYFQPDNNGTTTDCSDLLQAMLSCRHIPSVWNKLYRASLLAVLPYPEALAPGEDLLMNLRVFPHIKRAGTVSKPLYRWTYSGLGKSYFTDRWSTYKHVMQIARDMLPAISEQTGIHLHELSEWLNEGYENNVKERIIQTYFAHGDYHAIAEAEGLPPDFTDKAIDYLHNHRKFYNFIRVMQKIHGI